MWRVRASGGGVNGGDIGTAKLMRWAALLAPWALALVCAVCASAAVPPVQPGIDVSTAIASPDGHLTGEVTDVEHGTPLAQVSVCAEVPGYSYCTQTTPDGGYALNDLPAGKYDVKFEAREQNFVSQYYGETLSRSSAGLVTIAEGATVSGIDAALKVGGIVRGKVAGPTSGKGLEGILVCVTPVELPSELFGECATSQASGEYALERLESGRYLVQFWPESTYLRQYYNDEPTAALADAVTVTAGKTVTGIDAVLQRGGAIEGTVSSQGAAPAAGIQVCAVLVGDEPWQGQCTRTPVGGIYAISPLAGGEYKVDFRGAGNLLGQYYMDRSTEAEAVPVKVIAESSTTGIDASLTEGGKIEGRATNVSTGEPIAQIEVCARAEPRGQTCAGTDAAGEYKLEGLAPGNYAVSFDPWSENYLSQYYAGVTTESAATKVTVATGTTRAGIDAALQPGGEITGTVLDGSTDTPIEGAEVCARAGNGFLFEDCALSGAGGRYTVLKLASGAYTVRFSAADFVVQYYHEAGTTEEAEPVAVTAGSTTSAINASLEQGAAITGRVTSAKTGDPLDEIRVCAVAESVGASELCARSGPSGEYSITGLAPGEYSVSFYGTGYPSQYYPGTFSYPGLQAGQRRRRRHERLDRHRAQTGRGDQWGCHVGIRQRAPRGRRAGLPAGRGARRVRKNRRQWQIHPLGRRPGVTDGRLRVNGGSP